MRPSEEVRILNFYRQRKDIDMVKKFERVMDPEKARAGDFLLFPKGVRALNLKPGTLAKYGLSVGETSRSDNSWDVVRKWMSRQDLDARLFMVAGPQYMAAPSDNELMLSLDATVMGVREDPSIRIASLVPFGPAMWSMKQWAACWDDVHDGAVRKALAGKMGADAVLCNGSSGREHQDEYASQVWDTNDALSGAPSGADVSDDWFPTIGRGSEEIDASAFDLPTVARWDGCGWGSKRSRILFKSGFLSKLASKGAQVLRPTAEFVSLVTDELVSWWCAELSCRFMQRANASRRYLDGLKADMKRDRARSARYARQCGRSMKSMKPVRETLLAETGVEL